MRALSRANLERRIKIIRVWQGDAVIFVEYDGAYPERFELGEVQLGDVFEVTVAAQTHTRTLNSDVWQR